jgi:hypothetical protein
MAVPADRHQPEAAGIRHFDARPVGGHFRDIGRMTSLRVPIDQRQQIDSMMPPTIAKPLVGTTVRAQGMPGNIATRHR